LNFEDLRISRMSFSSSNRRAHGVVVGIRFSGGSSSFCVGGSVERWVWVGVQGCEIQLETPLSASETQSSFPSAGEIPTRIDDADSHRQSENHAVIQGTLYFFLLPGTLKVDIICTFIAPLPLCLS
jgi:hypothetical protein